MARRILVPLLSRIAATLAIASAPLLGAALAAFAWSRASALAGAGATLADAVAVGAAGVGASALALLTMTTVLAALAPMHSRMRTAALRAMPGTWRRLVTVALTGAVGASLALPAAAAPGAGWLDPRENATAAERPSLAVGISTAESPPRLAAAPDDPAPHTPDGAAPSAGWAAAVAEPAGTSPTTVPTSATESTEAAAATAQGTGPTPTPDADAAGRVVTVEPGDSLWAITARESGGSGTDVAASWPDLYALNRGVVGPDPDLIHPGQRLALPAEWSR